MSAIQRGSIGQLVSTLPLRLVLMPAAASTVMLADVSHAQPQRSETNRVPIASVVDVATDARGRVYVADDRAGTIHILDGDLAYVSTVGKAGRGEGEFQALRAVRVVNDSSFVGIDRYLRRVYFWTWRTALPHLVGTMELPFEPYDLCVLPNRRFLVLGLFENRRLHEVDERGRILSSFAPVDSGLVRAIAERISRGNVVCSPEGEILLTSTAVPRVEVYRVAGQALASTVYLSPVRVMGIEQKGAGALFTNPTAGFHAAHRGILTASSWLIGARVIGRSDGTDVDSVRMFSIDRKRGKLSTHVEAVGRLFPLGGDRALRVIDADGLRLAIVSLRTLGLPAAMR